MKKLKWKKLLWIPLFCLSIYVLILFYNHLSEIGAKYTAGEKESALGICFEDEYERVKEQLIPPSDEAIKEACEEMYEIEHGDVEIYQDKTTKFIK